MFERSHLKTSSTGYNLASSCFLKLWMSFKELAAHFHLASTSVVQPGDGYSQADIDANTKAAMAEAAAAEEVLRCFRASATVSDSQQRRFHTFVARSCRNLMSPKRPFGGPQKMV